MKASVLITTYNQEDLIGQAIESALAQVTDFDYEIVIGEDCSTDQTRSVVRSYGERYPDRIRPLFREKNLGLMANFPQSFLACRGEYVACLDGDDYWTFPHKLQRQVDFLDAHPDYSICFHNALMVWEDGSQAPTLHSPPGRRSTYRIEELLPHDFISTSAAVVRRRAIEAFPSWYATMPVPDWPFFVLHALRGKIGYLDEEWSVYRQHDRGMYCRLADEKRMEQNIRIEQIFRDALGPEWQSLLSGAIHSRCLMLALHYRDHGEMDRAKTFARMSVREAGRGLPGSWRLALKVFAYMHFPALPRLMSQRRARTDGRSSGEPAAPPETHQLASVGRCAD
jgi:glycosyltransferase involved in cell wall biosynthesis